MDNIEAKEYKCEFRIFYLPCPNFKEKQCLILRNLISSGRIGREMQFSSFANVSFEEDDKQLRYATIKKLDNFTRSKTNCMIFDVPESDKNPGVYDKCFVFMQGSHEPKYSYIMYNSKTEHNIHKFLIPLEDDSLVISIQGLIDGIKNCLQIEEYSHRLDDDNSYKKYLSGINNHVEDYSLQVHCCDRFYNRRY